MSKKNLLIVLIFSSIVLLNGFVISSEIDVENRYESNVLNLSDEKMDSYLDGETGENYEIETADDFVTSIKIDFLTKNKLMGHTNNVKISLDYDKYWMNEIFGSAAVGVQTKQYFSRNLDLTLRFTYHPEIYVNNYVSVLDGSFHQYKYDKNIYAASLKYDILNSLSFRYLAEFSQLYFDEYFTEYDAKNLENNIRLMWNFSDNFHARISFGYKISDADAEKAYEDIIFSGVIKDASYQADKFQISWTVPVLLKINQRNIRWYSAINYEQRYFQSDYVDDEYHYSREDMMLSVNSNIRFDLLKNVKVKFFGKYEIRETTSFFEAVANDKSYNAYQAGINLEFKM